ncbi:polysaccharide biosynthesis C-terminal domain-containing protein [Mucilaginibacter boryungensis]|uniref:NAD-dependent epimerase/dehydratase family protein n=1 Tax=Mucilaginibacter boryungensis TaxID=768480 RepID=A0ABR9XF99_9SPHI|nr:NAD-dependent epimerase/dehydratase family protein [Mucilaginibacter boryungensis]MBE9665842.1 NAD-dependent epimerase/dehydratase family protein [Mucilaginibacter boryungensis]
MIKIGITGQNGFIGQHLYNTLGLFKDEYERVEFRRDFFKDEIKLKEFVAKCDVIVHLAAMNRHPDPSTIYHNNINLVKKLIDALSATNSKAHVLFSSSSQEEGDNLYGKSKKDGRELLFDWAQKAEANFTAMIIPNVFGPFGAPNYNSFIATFCHKIVNAEQPQINNNSSIKLIYVGNLVSEIIEIIKNVPKTNLITIPHHDEYKVSEILNLLQGYKSQYMDLGIVPLLRTKFEINLFNTFRSYIDLDKYYPIKLTSHADDRGAFVEIIRLNTGGQISFSTTFAGVTRGNHFHTRKIERFAVIKGNALIQLRKIGSNTTINFHLSGDEPAYVDMPIWYTHNIKNVGREDLYTIFWINEFFNPEDPDTYFETV